MVCMGNMIVDLENTWFAWGGLRRVARAPSPFGPTLIKSYVRLEHGLHGERLYVTLGHGLHGE